MKVYMCEGGEKRLIGRADLPDDAGPLYELPLFGAASVIVEPFIVGVVAHPPAKRGGVPVVERAVLAAPGQLVDLLPGWEPLAS